MVDNLADLLADLDIEKDKLYEVDFIVNDKLHKIYYKEMTGEDYNKIRQKSILRKKEIQLDGSITESQYIDDDELRVNIILDMARDEKGNRLFSMTNPEHKTLVKKMKFTTQSFLAYEMGMKPERDMLELQRANIKKMITQG